VVPSSDGRWQRQAPRPREYRWREPLSLAEVDQLWQNYQREWVRRLSAQHIVSKTAGHFVHRDEPPLVTHIVEAVIEAARNNRPVHLHPAAVAANVGRIKSAEA
jgi:hypothetical protein